MTNGKTTPAYMIVNGQLVPYPEATVHLMSPAMRYGLNVFEGLRAYWSDSDKQLYVFRLHEHLERLRQSMKLLRFDTRFTLAEVRTATLELLRANEIKDVCHLRISAYLDGDGEHHVSGPVSYFVAAKLRPRLPTTATGIRCRVSTWVRMADNAMPPRIKCGANYVNARLARYEAHHDGYDDALMLNAAGRVAEGPGACVFMVRRGVLVTPPITEGILESITPRHVDRAGERPGRRDGRKSHRPHRAVCMRRITHGRLRGGSITRNRGRRGRDWRRSGRRDHHEFAKRVLCQCHRRI